MQRIQTGIINLDELIEGGVPKGSITLVSGSPGTGKSILAQQFIHHGASLGEKGLYVSLEQRIPEVFEHAKRFGWDFESLEKQGAVKFAFLDLTSTNQEQETHLSTINNMIDEYKPKRIVIDSISPIANMPVTAEELASYGLISDLSAFMPLITPELITRFQIHKLIMMLKQTRATSIITSELPRDSNWLSSDKVSEFLADNVFVLNYSPAARQRTLTIEKMRATKHVEEILPMIITNKGIKVTRAEEVL